MQLLKHYTGNSKHFKSNSVYSCFRFGPFREGCAVTIATAIRRALFQDVPSTAIVQVIFQHPTDEFSTLEGIQESTLDFLLNIKNLAIRGYCDGYVKGGISKKDCLHRPGGFSCDLCVLFATNIEVLRSQ